MHVVWLLLLWCVDVLEGTIQPPADLHHDYFDGMQPLPRFIFNPLSVFGNPECEYRSQKGSCYGEVECLALAGRYGNFCSGLHGLCCLFIRTCGQRSSQSHIYFRNVQHPLEDRTPSECSVKVIKRSDEYCGVTVSMVEADLPEESSRGGCDETYFTVTGTPQKQFTPQCGRLTGRKFTYDVSHIEEIDIHMKSHVGTSLSFNMHIEQVKCTEFTGENFGDVGSSGTGDVSKPVFPPTHAPSKPVFPPTHAPASKPPVVPPTQAPATGASPPAPPPGGSNPGSTTTSRPISSNNAQCGIRGPSFSGNTRNPSFGRRRRPDFEYAMSERRRKTPHRSTNERNRGKNRQENRNSNTAEAAVTSLDWAVPDLSDTLFAYYAGEPSVFDTRITYGQLAGMREFPWLVAMTVNGRFHCGGSIISNEHILTAAHCVISYKHNPGAIKLSLGDWDLGTSNDGPSVSARVARVNVHPSYSRSTLQNDIAVLKLTEKITFKDDIKPICLPTTDVSTEGEQAIVSGWGRNENKRLQTQLHYLRSVVVSNVLCDQRWNAEGAARGFIVNSHMCMDATNGDSCNGDSGGPSVLEDPPGSGRYIQIGVVSFGSGSCTDANLPGVYTRVSYFRNWIQQQMY